MNANSFNLPLEIKNSIDCFTVFYNKNFPKRSLQFSFLNSTCEIEGKIGGKNYTFVVNTPQAAILLLYNEPTLLLNGITPSDIISKLKITQEDLKTLIPPLLGSRIIIKTPENNNFKLNPKFGANSKRIKVINNPKAEDLIRKEKIEDDRAFTIEANIVRIMKSEKRLSHNDLINKLLEQLEIFKVKIHVK